MSAGDDLRRKAKRIRSVAEQATVNEFTDLRQRVLQRATVDLGGDLKLSGLKNGRPFKVIRSTKATPGLIDAQLKPSPKAPWKWVDQGTAPHRFDKHPGTPAKRTWQDTVEDDADALMARIERRLAQAIAE